MIHVDLQKRRLDHMLDESRIMAGEIKFMRTASYTYLHYKKNSDIIKEINTPVMKCTEHYYRANWKNIVLQKHHTRTKFQIPCYQPNGKNLWGDTHYKRMA
jgi:hypothetical protein